MRGITKSIRTGLLTCFAVAGSAVMAEPPRAVPVHEAMGAKLVSPNYNQMVLNAIRKMPKGGGYETSRRAAKGLRYSMVYRDNQLVVNARHAVPSYCSGATYLAFLYAVKDAEARGYMKLTQGDAIALLARGQADGAGVWGRWNANGPGTAVFFHETGIGKNFESYQEARAGDFMKIFWTDEIGKKEFGHSVVYLGTFKKDGQTWVKFWSSNKNQGYGEKSVPMSKIKWAIFSRITDIRKVGNVDRLSKKNTFLADMLSKSFTQKDVRKKTGMKSTSRRTFLGL